MLRCAHIENNSDSELVQFTGSLGHRLLMALMYCTLFPLGCLEAVMLRRKGRKAMSRLNESLALFGKYDRPRYFWVELSSSDLNALLVHAYDQPVNLSRKFTDDDGLLDQYILGIRHEIDCRYAAEARKRRPVVYTCEEQQSY